MLIPVLMSATGMPAAAVLATNKVAAVTGTASAAMTLARQVGVPRASWVFAAAAGAASAGGAAAVALISDEVVRPAIIILLLAVGAFVTLRPQFGMGDEQRVVTGRRQAIALCAAAVIGFYDGIFGPGTGMFLIMAFTGGYVHWPLALSLAVANVIGAQLGARTVLGGGSRLVRTALLALVVVLSIRLLITG